MAKKQYRIEIDEVTTDTLTALQGANISFKLYEVNEVKRESGSFASGSNFATTELLLKEVDKIDDNQYDPQTLKNYTANLTRNIPHVMEKIVKIID